MAVVAIQASAWQNASARDRAIFRVAAEHVAIRGTPPVYTVGGNDWFVSEDERFRLIDIGRLGVVAAGIAQNTTYQLPVSATGDLLEDQLRIDMVAWVQPRIVWPVPDLQDDPNPWQTVLDAQGAPAAFRAAAGIPDGMTLQETP